MVNNPLPPLFPGHVSVTYDDACLTVTLHAMSPEPTLQAAVESGAMRVGIAEPLRGLPVLLLQLAEVGWVEACLNLRAGLNSAEQRTAWLQATELLLVVRLADAALGQLVQRRLVHPPQAFALAVRRHLASQLSQGWDDKAVAEMFRQLSYWRLDPLLLEHTDMWAIGAAVLG